VRRGVGWPGRGGPGAFYPCGEHQLPFRGPSKTTQVYPGTLLHLVAATALYQCWRTLLTGIMAGVFPGLSGEMDRYSCWAATKVLGEP